MILRPLTVAALAFVGGLAACADAPYVYAPELIDRDDPQFATDRTDRTTFTICYAKWESRPEDVRDLANKECGRYGKRAAFIGSTLQVCPLMAPAGASYACLGKGQTLADVLSGEAKRRSVLEQERQMREGENLGGSPVGSGWPSATDPFR